MGQRQTRLIQIMCQGRRIRDDTTVLVFEAEGQIGLEIVLSKIPLEEMLCFFKKTKAIE